MRQSRRGRERRQSRERRREPKETLTDNFLSVERKIESLPCTFIVKRKTTRFAIEYSGQNVYRINGNKFCELRALDTTDLPRLHLGHDIDFTLAVAYQIESSLLSEVISEKYLLEMWAAISIPIACIGF